MKRVTQLALATLVVLSVATGIAAAGPINFPWDPKPTIHPTHNVTHAINNAVLGRTDAEPAGETYLVALACEVAGDDLRVINKGSALDIGARIKWAAADETGIVKLKVALSQGGSFKLADILDGDAEDCLAKVL
jgi:hypothetical protein